MARRSSPRGTSNLSLAKTRSDSRQPKLESPMKRHGREDPVTAVSLEFGVPSPWNARAQMSVLLGRLSLAKTRSERRRSHDWLPPNGSGQGIAKERRPTGRAQRERQPSVEILRASAGPITLRRRGGG